jgi:hypothetical protein
MAKKKIIPQVSDELPFELGKWQNFEQWRCKLCPFDTLEGEDEFWLHYAQAHEPKPQSAPIIQIYGRSGRPVTK